MIKAINDNRVFQRLNRLGYKFFNPNFLVVMCNKDILFKDQIEVQQDNFCYYGIRISKKVGKAVVRNKIRRRFRSILHQLDKVESIRSKAFMIVPKTRCATIEFSTLSFEVEKCIKSK